MRSGDYSYRILCVSVPAVLSLIAAPLSNAGTSAADALLRSVTTPKDASLPSNAPRADGSQTLQNTAVTLSDPFLAQLFASVQVIPDLSFEARAWMNRFFNGQVRDAAHQWRAIQPHLTSTVLPSAQIAWLYSLWKLNLPQTFTQAWFEAQANPALASHRLMQTLEQVMAPTAAQWLQTGAVALTPSQEQQLTTLGEAARTSPVALSYRALSAMRKGDAALSVVSQLAPDHALKMPLAQTAALAAARRGDLAAAGGILKAQLEPALERLKDPEQLAQHYLQIARLLYQAGVLDGARTYYERIPEKAQSFLTAREELAWVMLRQGDHSSLRGLVKTLSLPLWKDRFAPELPLVRAVSNLKLCYYDAVEQDFADFLERNRPWATRIQQALVAPEPPAPVREDPYSRRALARRAGLEQEMARLTELGDTSLSAGLPAVGRQMHWDELRTQLQGASEIAKKEVSDEYRRSWRAASQELKEAIRKMQFVKVELLSQLHQLAQNQSGERDQLTTSQASAVSAPAAKLDVAPERQVFPFDGVVWADELFRLKGVAPSRCQNLGGAR